MPSPRLSPRERRREHRAGYKSHTPRASRLSPRSRARRRKLEQLRARPIQPDSAYTSADPSEQLSPRTVGPQPSPLLMPQRSPAAPLPDTFGSPSEDDSASSDPDTAPAAPAMWLELCAHRLEAPLQLAPGYGVRRVSRHDLPISPRLTGPQAALAHRLLRSLMPGAQGDDLDQLAAQYAARAVATMPPDVQESGQELCLAGIVANAKMLELKTLSHRDVADAGLFRNVETLDATGGVCDTRGVFFTCGTRCCAVQPPHLWLRLAVFPTAVYRIDDTFANSYPASCALMVLRACQCLLNALERYAAEHHPLEHQAAGFKARPAGATDSDELRHIHPTHWPQEDDVHHDTEMQRLFGAGGVEIGLEEWMWGGGCDQITNQVMVRLLQRIDAAGHDGRPVNLLEAAIGGIFPASDRDTYGWSLEDKAAKLLTADCARLADEMVRWAVADVGRGGMHGSLVWPMLKRVNDVVRPLWDAARDAAFVRPDRKLAVQTVSALFTLPFLPTSQSAPRMSQLLGLVCGNDRGFGQYLEEQVRCTMRALRVAAQIDRVE